MNDSRPVRGADDEPDMQREQRQSSPASPSCNSPAHVNESRLPPPGSFRSGLYRLLRAIFFNQGPSTRAVSLPAKRGLAPNSPPADSRKEVGLPDRTGTNREITRRPRSRYGPIQRSMYWLAQAMLISRLLPQSVRPAGMPARYEGLPAARWRPVLPDPAGFLRRPRLIRDKLRAASARVRALTTPEEELVVPRLLEVALVVSLTAGAAFLRIWNLEDVPVGIHGDETEMAMEALRSIEGESIGIWTGVTLGNPAGYAHWMALIFRLGEASVTTMRLASAIPGIAIVPVGYLLVRSLFPFRVAILSAVLLTVSFWFIIQSRIAFGGITAVFVALLAMWLLLYSVRSGRPWMAVLAGVALGLGLYTFKSFLFYFTGAWIVAVMALATNRELLRRPEVWLCLGVSVLVGAPMLLFYATSGYIGPNLNDVYSVSIASPETWLRVPGLALDAVLLVNRPVEGNTVDGSPAIPVLTALASVFFWVGLAAVLLFIKEKRHLLLVAAWLIGMTPILLVPGAEGRRYLLGLFFVLTFASIGVNTVLVPLTAWLRTYFSRPVRSPAVARQLAVASAVTVAIAFAGLFAVQNLREYDRWGDGESVKWFFNYEYHQSLLFLKELPPDIPVLLYTARQPFDNSIRRFELPDATGVDGAEEYGGTGVIPPPSDLREDTVLVLLDRYLPLAAEIESSHPLAIKLREVKEDGKTLFAAYLVPGDPPDAGAGVAPLPRNPP